MVAVRLLRAGRRGLAGVFSGTGEQVALWGKVWVLRDMSAPDAGKGRRASVVPALLRGFGHLLAQLGNFMHQHFVLCLLAAQEAQGEAGSLDSPDGLPRRCAACIDGAVNDGVLDDGIGCGRIICQGPACCV